MSETTARHAATGGINDVFPYKVCINLDRRGARWQQMQLKFERSGIHSVHRFSGFDGEKVPLPANWAHTPGAYGCLLSHLHVVREARRLGMASVLVEGGAKVAEAFLAEGLVDRIVLFQGSAAIGKGGIASPIDANHIPAGFRKLRDMQFGKDSYAEWIRDI